jgi:hypothetical protein
MCFNGWPESKQSFEASIRPVLECPRVLAAANVKVSSTIFWRLFCRRYIDLGRETLRMYMGTGAVNWTL